MTVEFTQKHLEELYESYVAKGQKFGSIGPGWLFDYARDRDAKLERHDRKRASLSRQLFDGKTDATWLDIRVEIDSILMGYTPPTCANDTK